MDKKFFMGIAAMAALTLVSCSSDDLNSLSDNSSKNEAISFDGYLGRSAVAVNGSRGSVETKETLKTKGFGVFSKYTGTASFPDFVNQKVTCPDTKWTYSPLKFWPTQGKIDFLAYAPYVDNKTLNNTSFEFTVDPDVARQTDLLWANAKEQAKTDKEPVKFSFNHALSRLGYTVKLYGDYSSTDATNKATFKLNQITLAGSADGKTPAFYKKATIDLSKAPSEGPWSNQSSSDKQKIDWVSTPYDLTSTKAYNPDTNNNYLFVIPQDFSKTTEGADKLYVIVEYTITYNDGKTQTNKVYRQLKQNFLQGKAYMLNMTIGLPIEFDVTVVEGWGDDNVVGEDSWVGINH